MEQALAFIDASGLSQEEKDILGGILLAEPNIAAGIALTHSDGTLREVIRQKQIPIAIESVGALIEKLHQLLETLRNWVNAVDQKINNLITSLANAELRRLRQDLDCWPSNGRSVFESAHFKNALADYYHCAGPGSDLKCMLTGNYYPRPEVRALHIIKNENVMHLYGLPLNNFDHPRNGLLLLEPIEQAFGTKDLCFLYNAMTNQLMAKVLNSELMPELLPKVDDDSSTDSTYPITYGDVDGLVLQLPPAIFPYRRALSMHAKFAFSRALRMGWITDRATVDSYFQVSDSGLDEPLGVGDLTWQEVHVDIYGTPL